MFMSHKKWLIAVLLTTLLWSETLEMSKLSGAWHLRVMDGMEVRKARAILDFQVEKMQLSGFDSCNRIGGALQKNSDTNMTVPMLMSTRMACREPIHNWVSQRLHETLTEGFNIIEEEKYGVEGITLKSPSHELFLKKMGKTQ
jgi:heat shock protein HslJ